MPSIAAQQPSLLPGSSGQDGGDGPNSRKADRKVERCHVDVVAESWRLDIYFSAERGVVGLICKLKLEEPCCPDPEVGVGRAGRPKVIAENVEGDSTYNIDNVCCPLPFATID